MPTFIIQYHAAQNNHGRGYRVDHDTLSDLMRSEGQSNYAFTCPEHQVIGIVMLGRLLGLFTLGPEPPVRIRDGITPTFPLIPSPQPESSHA